MNKKHMENHLSDEALEAVSGGNGDCRPDTEEELRAIDAPTVPVETMPIHPITPSPTPHVDLRSKGIVILGREEK